MIKANEEVPKTPPVKSEEICMDVTPEDDDDNDIERQVSPRTLLGVDQSAVFLVCLVNFVDSLGGTISTPILPFYAKTFHASYTQIGWLYSTFAIAGTIAMPALSYGADKYGRRPMLLLCCVGSAVGGAWQGLALDYTSLLVARIFSGLWSGVGSVCQVYIVDVVPPEYRPIYMSYLLSSTQASALFGPSLGAGLSALGYNYPVLVQSAISMVLFFVVYAHLSESPEWCRLTGPDGPASPNPHGAPRMTRRHTGGIGRRTTFAIVGVFGALAFCGMVSQMAMLSMFAVYAKDIYGFDSVRAGFTMTLGAVASVGTNIWISPPTLQSLGEFRAGLLGFALIAIGSLGTVECPLHFSVLSFMLAYQGLAINSSAVMTAAANLTDKSNRATVMTGVRMMKSLGAVVGPTLAGWCAEFNVGWPFYCASLLAVVGFGIDLLTVPISVKVKQLLKQRSNIGSNTALLDGTWLDEYGTPEEISDLGNFVADLLTSRHYRWVTYNDALKSYLRDSFPPLPTQSDYSHRQAYDRRRQVIRERGDQLEHLHWSYEELKKQFEELRLENDRLRDRCRARSGSWERGRGRSLDRSRKEHDDPDQDQKDLAVHQLMASPGVPQ